MNACMSEFRIVNPTLRTFSAAEARIAHSSIRFNNLSAAELGYPEHIRLLISSDGCTLAIQACDPKDKCAVPFMAGRTADDLKGQKKWTTVSNRMLTHIIRSKLGWETAKTPRRFYGVPWPDRLVPGPRTCLRKICCVPMNWPSPALCFLLWPPHGPDSPLLPCLPVKSSKLSMCK